MQQSPCKENSFEQKAEPISLPGSPTQLTEDLLKSNSMPSFPVVQPSDLEPLVICDQKRVDELYDLVVEVCLFCYSIKLNDVK